MKLTDLGSGVYFLQSRLGYILFLHLSRCRGGFDSILERALTDGK